MKHDYANGFSLRSLRWSDEFEGPKGSCPNPETWQAEEGGHGWGNEELQFYTADIKNAHLDGFSNLAIVVSKTSAQMGEQSTGDPTYTSARLISKHRVKTLYGLIQARIKLPAGRGIWPAFWMLGENIDKVGWPHCGEIDVMENFGKDPFTVQGTVHGPGYAGKAGISGWHSSVSALSDDFHLYSVLWEPDRILWYFDEKSYATVARRDLHGNPWVFDHEFYFLLNVAVGGVPSVEPDASVDFPQVMLIDYIRVFETAPNISFSERAELPPPEGKLPGNREVDSQQ
jgi:beta-glucanase (GH16 family)